MITKKLSPVTTTLGVSLLILSFAWPSLVDPNSIWSIEQEQERGNAIGELHRVSHHPSPGDNVEQARERLKRSNVALQKARDRHQWTITFLKWSGILLVGAGAIAFHATRNSKKPAG